METIKTWIISDKSGRDLYYFEIFKVDNETLHFDTNLHFLMKHHVIIDCIQVLLSNYKNDNLRDVIANHLFKLIRMTKYLRQFYFNNTVLDVNGKLDWSLYRLIQELNAKKLELKDSYVPFSAYHMPELFNVFNHYFIIHKFSIIKNSVQLNKTQFERQLINDKLRFQYINVYHPDNYFYSYLSNQEYYTYYILRNNQLIMGFRVPL